LDLEQAAEYLIPTPEIFTWDRVLIDATWYDTWEERPEWRGLRNAEKNNHPN